MKDLELCLFLVQDSDRPLYVLAPNWQTAVERWQQVIRRENDMEPDEDCQPSGIHLVASADEIVLPVSEVFTMFLNGSGTCEGPQTANDDLPAPTEETDATAQSDPGVLRVRAPAAPPAEGVEADRRPGAADGSGPAAVGGGVGRAAEAARGQGLPGEGGAVDPQAAGDVGVDGGPIGCPVEDARCYGGGCLSLPECERKAQGGVQ